MAISFVGSYALQGAFTSGLVVNFSNLRDASNAQPTLQEGDLVIVSINNASTVDRGTALIPTTPSGYAAVIANQYANDSNDTNLQLSYKFMTSTPDTSVTIPGANALTAGMTYDIHVFRGVDPTTPFDVTVVGVTGTNGGQPNPGAITPSTAGAWIFIAAASAMAAGATLQTTAPTGMSTATNAWRSVVYTAQTNDPALACGYKSDWTSGAYDCAQLTGGTSTNTGSWAAVTVALRPVPTLGDLDISGSKIVPENSAQGTTIGAVTGGTSGSTITLQDSASNKVQLTSGVIEVGSAGINYEAGTSFNITLRETKAGATNSPKDTVVTITVSNVDESALTQAAFRFYEDGTASSSTAIAAQNTNITRAGTSAVFQLRILLQETAGEGFSSGSGLYYSKNGGAWTAVTPSSSNVRITAGGMNELFALTSRLTGGTGTFGECYPDESAGQSLYTVAASGYVEPTWSLQLQPLDLTDGDTLDFRAYRTSSIAANAYTVTPRITISSGPLTYTSTVTVQTFSLSPQTLNVKRILKVSVPTAQTFALTSQNLVVKKIFKTPVTVQTYALTAVAGQRVLYHRRTPVTVQSFNVTPQTVNTLYHRKIPVTVQSFAITSQTVLVKYGRKVAVQAIAFNSTAPPIATLYNRRIPVTVQSYTLTPQTLFVGKRFPLVVTAQSYAITSQTINLRTNRKVIVTPQTFAITPQTINLNRKYVSKVDATSFAITPQTVAVRKVYTVPVTAQSYTLTAQNFTQRVIKKSIVTAQSYALTSQTVNVKKIYRSTVTPITFTITSQNIALRASRKVPVTVQTFTITPQNLYARKVYKIPVTVQSFAITPQTINLRKNYKTIVTPQTYTVTGSNVALQYGTIIRVAVNSVAYNITSQNVALRRSYRSPVTSVAFTTTSQNVVLKKIYRSTVTTQSFAITPQTITLTKSDATPITGISSVITPQNINLRVIRKTIVAQQTYSLTSQTVRALANRRSGITSISYALNAQTIGVRASRRVGVTTQSYTITPRAFTQLASRRTQVDTSSISVIAGDINVRANRFVTVLPATAEITTYDVGYQRTYASVIQSVAFNVQSQDVNTRIVPVGGVFTAHVTRVPMVVQVGDVGVYVLRRTKVYPTKYSIKMQNLVVRAPGQRIVRVPKRTRSVVKVPRRRNVARVRINSKDGTVKKMHLTWETKDPSTTLDYIVDWSDWLAGETIASHSIELENDSSGLEVVSSQIIANGKQISVLLRSGTSGKTGSVNCTVTTSTGKVGKTTVNLLIRSH